MTRRGDANLAQRDSEQRLIGALSDHYLIIKEESRTETLTFLDTFDWRLFRTSLLLYQAGSDLILCDRFTGDVFYRQLFETPVQFVWDLPAGDLKSKLEPIIEMRALLPFSGAHFRSAQYRLLNEDEKTVVRLRYEAVAPTPEGNGASAAEQLYLKPVRGYDKQAKKARQHLEKIGFEARQQNLFSQVLSHGERTPGDYSAKLDLPLEPQMRADEATKIIMRFLLWVMKQNEAGVKQDIDTEFLHDFRVAIRRTRSALSQIKGVFPEAVTTRFKQEFSTIGKLTNNLRDLDVYLLAEDDYKAMLPDLLCDDIAPLFDYLRQKRAAALEKTVKGLNSKPYADTLRVWEQFLNEPVTDAPTGPNGDRPVIDLACERIGKKYRRIIKQGKRLLRNAQDEQLHDLRIECKKLRYLLEFFANLFPPKKINRLIKQLKKLQTNLGDFNDFSVQEIYLLTLADELPLTDVGSKKTLVAIGSLVDALHQERLRVKAEFAQTFINFATPVNQKRFKALFRRRRGGHPR